MVRNARVLRQRERSTWCTLAHVRPPADGRATSRAALLVEMMSHHMRPKCLYCQVMTCSRQRACGRLDFSTARTAGCADAVRSGGILSERKESSLVDGAMSDSAWVSRPTSRTLVTNCSVSYDALRMGSSQSRAALHDWSIDGPQFRGDWCRATKEGVVRT